MVSRMWDRFLGAFLRAIDKSGYTKDEIVLVSGIGCTGRIPTYVDFNTLHTTHGRALTFATGIKLVKPELKVIVVMGMLWPEGGIILFTP